MRGKVRFYISKQVVLRTKKNRNLTKSKRKRSGSVPVGGLQRSQGQEIQFPLESRDFQQARVTVLEPGQVSVLWPLL